jgi:hypothetical protein
MICLIDVFARDNDENKVFWIRDYSAYITEETGFIEIEIFGKYYDIEDTFPVVAGTEYEVLVHADVVGQGLCSPTDTDKLIFSSPSASSTSEIMIPPEYRQNPATGQYAWYCVKNYNIESIWIE